jgi:hypothetical protein
LLTLDANFAEELSYPRARGPQALRDPSEPSKTFKCIYNRRDYELRRDNSPVLVRRHLVNEARYFGWRRFESRQGGRFIGLYTT